DMVNQIKSAADTTGIDAALVFNSEQEIAKLQNGGGGENAVQATYDVGLKDKDGEAIQVTMTAPVDNEMVDDLEIKIGAKVNADGELDGYTLTMVDRFGEDKTVDWDGKKTVDLGKLFGDEQYNGIKLNGLSKDADPGQTISDLYTAETVSQTKDEYAGIGSGEMRLDFNPTDTEATNLKNAGVSSVDVTASGSSQAPDFTVALKDANGDVIKEAKLTSDQLLALSDDPDSGVTYDDLTGFNVDDLGKAMASLATTDEEKAQAQKDFGGISFGVDGFVGTPNAARMEPVTLSTGKISYQVSEDADLTLATLKVKSDHFEVEGASSTPKPAKPGYVEFSFGDEVGVDGRFSSRDAEAQEALRKAMAAYGSTADLNFQIGLADGATPDNMSYKLTAKIGTAEIVLAEDWDGKSVIDMSEIPPLDVSAEPKAQNLRDALANMGTLQFAGEVDGAAFGDTTMTNIKDNSGPVKLTNSLYGRDSGSITVGLGSDALENLHNTLKNATGAGAEETLAAFEKALQEGTLRIEYSTTGTQTHTDYDLELRLTDGTNVFDRTTITHAALGLNANGVTSTAGTTINAGASVFDGANIKIDDVKNRYDNGVTGAINNDSGSGIVSGVNLSRTIDSTTVTIEAPDLDNVTRTGGEYTKSTGYGDGPGGIEFTFDGLFDEDGNAVTFTSTSDTEELRARLTDTLVNAGFGAEDFELALRVEETADGSGTAASPKYDVFLDLSFNSGASSAIYKLTEGWDGKENTFTTSNIGLVDSYNLGSATVGVINNFVNELASFSFEVSGDISAAKSGFLGEPSFADINDLSIATNIYTSLAGNGGDLEMTLVEDDLKAIFAALVDDETRAKFMEEIAAGEITVDYSIQSKNGILEPNHTNGYAVNIALRSANTGNLYGTIVSTIDSVNADGSGASAATVFRSSATGAADVSLTNDALAATANTNENATGLDSASMVGVGTANLANAGAAQDFGTPATAPSSNTLVGATGINGYQDTDENDVVAASFTVANTNGNGTFTNTAGTDLDVTFTATNSSLDINYALQEALKAMDPDATIAFSFNGGGTTDRIANTVTATVTTGAGTYDLNIGEWDGVSPIDLSKISIAGNYTETNTALLNDVVDALKDLGSLEVTATNAGAPAVIDHGDTFGTNPELTVPTATSTTVLDNLYSANSGTVGLSLDEQAWKDIYAALVADVGSAGGADRLKAFEEAARGINNQNLAFKVAVTGGPADHGNYGLTITLTNGLTGSDEVELGTITLTHDQLGLNDSGVTQGAGTSLRNLNFDTIGGNTSQAFTGDGARLSVTDRQGGYRDNIVGDVNSQTGSYDYKNVNADITFNDPDTTHDGAAQFPVEDLLTENDCYKINKAEYLNCYNISGGVSTAESAGSSVRNKG
ncbi:MAG: hypothetical protein LIQ31_02245, partial [Planctomycetes bacterium]|nr:hypothetical protein [Planctomycetota bacterium]